MNIHFKSKISLFFVFVILFWLLSNNIEGNSTFNNSPIIDGKIGNNEWKNGDKRTIKMVDGTLIESYLSFNDTHLLILLQVTDDDPTLFGQSEFWDTFGIEFDINSDQVPMGLPSSPDDALFVSYSSNGGQDFFLQGMGNPAVEDITVGGSNDCAANIGLDGNKLIVEACKKLESGDNKGKDIAFQQGEEFYVMFAQWDNKDPHTQTTTHSDWIKYRVPQLNEQNLDELVFQVIIEIVVILVFIFGAALIRFNFHRKNLFQKH